MLINILFYTFCACAFATLSYIGWEFSKMHKEDKPEYSPIYGKEYYNTEMSLYRWVYGIIILLVVGSSCAFVWVMYLLLKGLFHG